MSYILDALRKSEQERQRGTPPGLATTHAPLRTPKGGRPTWPWLLAVGLLANAGILAWWIEPWKDRTLTGSAGSSAKVMQTSPEGVPSSTGAPVARAPKAEPVPADKGQVGSIETSERGAQRKSDQPTGVDKPGIGSSRKAPDRAGDPEGRTTLAPPSAATPPKPGPNRPSDPAKAAAPSATGSSVAQTTVPGAPSQAAKKEDTRRAVPSSQPSQAEPPAVVPPVPSVGASELGLMEDLKPLLSETRPSRKEPDFRQIPASLRNTLPKISVSFLVYSDKPSDRRVTINGRVFREGDEVAEGLKLEQITQEGAVLSYRGFQFHKGVF